MTQKLIVILGPTASGKTDLAIKLAKRFNGEIVSADSRQIFRNMDIATAKPKIKNGCFKGVPHYLIDSFPLNEELSVTIYKNLAVRAIKGIQKKGKLAFLVGGTGLYIKAVIDNLDFPKIVPDKDLRQKLEKKSLEELFNLYQKLDAEGAKMIDKNNKRRLVRALEVCYLSKQPFWQQRKQKKPLFEVLQIGIKLPKLVLNKNISIRTDKIMRLGLEGEIKTLFKKYGNLSILSQTIGYQEWLPYIKDRIDSKIKRQIAEKIENHTRQYAKRQLVWFKKDSRIIWLSKQDSFKKASKLISRFIL
jgi:tRNA dimethylallyltransferase